MNSDPPLSTTTFDSVRVAESRMFSFPTRLIDSWRPNVENIELPEFFLDTADAIVNVEKKTCKTFAEQYRDISSSFIKKIKRQIKKFLQKRQPRIDLGDNLVYDARGIYNGNIAHLIQHHLSKLQFLKKQAPYQDIKNSDIIILLTKKPHPLEMKFFNFLGFPLHYTNSAVTGNVIEVECDTFYHLLPAVSTMEFKNYIVKTPERIFISRKKSRTLINEEEIATFLKKEGYEKLYFENIPLNLQWSVMRNATDIVSIHGAALGALAFNNQWLHTDTGSKQPFRLTELFGAGFVVDCFRRYTAVLKGSWAACRGKISENIIRDIDKKGLNMAHAFEPFEINIESLKKALNYHDLKEPR
jgi:hypothetical protein